MEANMFWQKGELLEFLLEGEDIFFLLLENIIMSYLMFRCALSLKVPNSVSLRIKVSYSQWLTWKLQAMP